MSSSIKRIVAGVVLLAAMEGTRTASAQMRRISKDQYQEAMRGALEQVITLSQQGRKRAGRPDQASIDFSANLFFAHEAVIEHIETAILLKAVEAFREMGLRRIDINPGLFPWKNGDRPDVVKKYDAVIDAARRAGMKIVFNPQYSSTYFKIRSVEEWSRAALPVYAELARRYKPSVFVVAHEPSTMSKRMGVKSDTKAWTEFARAAAQTVKRESPQTRIGAGGLYTEEEAYKSFLELKEIDVMTINIYNLRGLKTYNQMIELAKRRNKPVYIAETWRPPYFEPRQARESLEALSASSVGEKEFEDLDVLWMEAMVQYAVTWQLESVTPFWMQTFFRYVPDGGSALSPDYNRSVAESISRSERTELFRRYQGWVRQYGRR